MRVDAVLVGLAESAPALALAANPNPTDDLLRLGSLPAARRYDVLDAAGRRVLDGPLDASLKTGTLSLEPLPSGLYTVVVRGRRGVARR